MKASELIAQLQALVDKYGDKANIECFNDGHMMGYFDDLIICEYQNGKGEYFFRIDNAPNAE